MNIHAGHTQPDAAQAAPAVLQPEPRSAVHIRAILNRPGYSCISSDGLVRGMELSFAKDINGLFPEGLRVRWMGPAAAAFLDANQLELRPGRAVDLSVYHIRARDNETRAYITEARLAPLSPSWVKHIEKTQTTNEPQHEPHQEHQA